MARNDLLIEVVRAGMAGDRAKLRAGVEAIAAEERAQRHVIFADRLIEAVAAKPGLTAKAPPLLTSAVRDGAFQMVAQRKLDDLTLPSPVKKQIKQLIEEHLRADLLRAAGIEPRHRILLSGPPGNGKTTLAEAIAEALGVDFFIVRYETIIASLLGETNTRLKRLFDQVRGRPCVLFFDEFDTIGKERGDENETGEIKRVVSNLLLQIDALPSSVVTIAATNHSELLDRAVWRRFEMRLTLPAPTEAELSAFFGAVFSSWKAADAPEPDVLAHTLYPLSYAEARDFCLNVRRRHILEKRTRALQSIVAEESELWQVRTTPDSDVVRPNKAAPKTRPSRGRKTHEGSKASAPVSGGVRKGKAKNQARTEVRSSQDGAGKGRQRKRPPK